MTMMGEIIGSIDLIHYHINDILDGINKIEPASAGSILEVDDSVAVTLLGLRKAVEYKEEAAAPEVAVEEAAVPEAVAEEEPSEEEASSCPPKKTTTRRRTKS